jgi:small GTP-binding protein
VEKRLLMLGLDNVGKTSLMFRMKDNAFSESVPTVGLNMETANYKAYVLTVWDVGGKARNMWKHYFEENSAVAYVIDSTD